MTRLFSSVARLGAAGVLLLAGGASAQPKPAAAAAPPAPAAAPAPSPAAAPPAPAPAPAASPDGPTAETAAAPPGAAPTVAPGATPAPATTAAQPPPAAPQPSAPYDGPPLLFTPTKGKQKLGAYGGIGVAYTHMLHRDGAVIDLEGALLIDHRMSLGLAGYAFTRSPNGPSAGIIPREYSTVYGGFFMRYAFFGDFPVYASVGGLIGGGTLALVEDLDREYGDDYHDDYHSHLSDFRGYFVFQPDVSLHVNATRWLRFTATGGYRVATAVNDFGYDGAAMSGAVVGGKVELGWF